MGVMRPPRRWAVGVVIAIVATALAGCASGASDYNDAVGRTSPPGTEVPLASPRALILPAPGATPPTTSFSPLTPGSDVPPIAGSASAFCRDIDNLQSLVTGLLASAASPAELNRARAQLAKLVADAPPELHGAVQTLIQLQTRVSQDLAARPPNSTDIISLFTEPEYQRSLQQIIGYSLTHCSINLTPPTT